MSQINQKTSPIPLYDKDQLKQDINSLANNASLDKSQLRLELLNHLKILLQNVYENAEQNLMNTGDGYGCAESLSQFQDELIEYIYGFTVQYIYKAENPSKSETMAVIATGGYGRGLLSPGSDIDLLFLLSYKQTAWGESVVEYILYLLWDLGFKVGHATRSIDQCIKLSRSDITIRTAVLDSRLILGDEKLYSTLKQKFHDNVVIGSGPEFIDAKLSEQEDRHERTGKSRYLVEPNIKDGKGGLRDLHTLYWISKYVTELEDATDFVSVGIFSSREYKNFNRCNKFLWTIRCHLHFLTKRSEERLTFDLQQEMAIRLKYKNRNGWRAVERFMRHYFLIAKEVGALTRTVCQSLELKELKSPPVISKLLQSKFWGKRKKIPDSSAFKLDNDRLSITHQEVFKKDPVNLIRLFNIAEKYKLSFHPDVIRLVRSSWPLIDDNLRNNPEANNIFLDLLCSPTNSESTLRKMNEVGVLGRFIRDFGKVVCMMQFNMYHHYTVDEHLILSVGILNEIENGDVKEELPILSKIFHRIHYRRALYVAMFLHDVAKGNEEDHSILGAKIATRLCPRLGLNKAETDTVAWLIENHLVMSQMAQSRDISDPNTIQEFANIVQSRERLMLLTILTVADIRAVGPGVWNGWKRQLLRTLYLAALPVLSGGHSDVSQEDRIKIATEKFAAKIDWPEAQAENFTQRHHPTYWLKTDVEQQVNHANLLTEWDETKDILVSQTKTDDKADITEITIITKTVTTLLSKIAGACALSGANIVSAQISTTLDDIAVDSIFLKKEFNYIEDEKRRSNRIITTLKKLLSGEKDISNLKLKNTSRQALRDVFSIEPELMIDTNLSDDFIVFEISCLDRPGLLYDLTTVFADLKIDISSAHIATFGEKAVDAFYIRKSSSPNLKKPSFLKKIEEVLINKLNSNDNSQ